MESLRSHLLIASPRLPDENFYHAVVLMIHHDESGAFGLVLNRPLYMTVSELWEMIGRESCDINEPVRQGGPVPGPLVALHTRPQYAETEILPGVYFAAGKEYLDKIVETHESPFRMFNGYSGWMSGQLEAELDAGGWLTLDAEYRHVFQEGDDLWDSLLRSIGRKITAPLVRNVGEPTDPSMN